MQVIEKPNPIAPEGGFILKLQNCKGVDPDWKILDLNDVDPESIVATLRGETAADVCFSVDDGAGYTVFGIGFSSIVPGRYVNFDAPVTGDEGGWEVTATQPSSKEAVARNVTVKPKVPEGGDGSHFILVTKIIEVDDTPTKFVTIYVLEGEIEFSSKNCNNGNDGASGTLQAGEQVLIDETGEVVAHRDWNENSQIDVPNSGNDCSIGSRTEVSNGTGAILIASLVIAKIAHTLKGKLRL